MEGKREEEQVEQDESSTDSRIDIPELLDVKESLTGLTDRLTTQEAVIKQVSTDVGLLKTTVENLEKTVNSELLATKGLVTGLSAQCTTKAVTINQISTDVGLLKATVQNLEKTANPELLAIKQSLTGLTDKFTTHDDIIKRTAVNVETLERIANPRQIQRTRSEEDIIAQETAVREINERETQIISEENELEQRLKSSLEKGLTTIATVFIYLISFMASSQEPSSYLFRFILEAAFIGIIWLATFFLLIIWWFELKNIKNEIVSLQERQRQLVGDAKSKGIRGIRPRIRLSTFTSHLCLFFTVVLAVLETGVSVYFGSITYSLWSSPKPSPSPSALPAIQLPSTLPLTTEYYAAQ